MKLSEGIEQAIHCVTMLAGLDEGQVLSAAALAEYHGVSASYLLKHLQALSGAGILATVPGPKGGYRLALAPKDVSLLDITLAIEGPAPAFRCAEIRQRGPKPLPGRYFQAPCGIASAMHAAERVYRSELAKTSIADIVAGVHAVDDDGAIAGRGTDFIACHARQTGR